MLSNKMSDAEVREIGMRLARLRDALSGEAMICANEDRSFSVLLKPPGGVKHWSEIAFGTGNDFETALRNAIKRAPWLRED